ncbi:hypothetical protein AAE02nite_47230 [Adhaeribacter aerolatus]|uniref:Uncharacterized protein n=1 Tax=Adhaeribacter aerolatus TaxID=670289 RepID=A0A512B541_9BACT|nr:hypothetical protein AAE02nite_47230 [Adhaeribacter aerolatus]
MVLPNRGNFLKDKNNVKYIRACLTPDIPVMRRISAARYAFLEKRISDWRKKKYTNYSARLTSSVPNALAGKRKINLLELEQVIFCYVYCGCYELA